MSSSLLQAGLFNHKVIYGTRGKIVRSWISLMWHYPVLVLLSMRLIGCIDVTLLWRNAHKGQSRSTATPCRIFVGFGAGPEEYMWERFKNASPILSIRLDQTNPSTFGSIYRPKVIDLWRKVWYEAKIAFEVIMNASIEPVQELRADYITQATTRLAQYAFFFQWWKGFNKDLKDIVFITPDIPVGELEVLPLAAGLNLEEQGVPLSAQRLQIRRHLRHAGHREATVVFQVVLDHGADGPSLARLQRAHRGRRGGGDEQHLEG